MMVGDAVVVCDIWKDMIVDAEINGKEGGHLPQHIALACVLFLVVSRAVLNETMKIGKILSISRVVNLNNEFIEEKIALDVFIPIKSIFY